MQVPNGSDWIEYMLYLPDRPTRAELGSADHFAPGVVSVAQLQSRLDKRGWKPAQGKNPQVLGVDGKLQIGLDRSRRHARRIHGVPASQRLHAVPLTPEFSPRRIPINGSGGEAYGNRVIGGETHRSDGNGEDMCIGSCSMFHIRECNRSAKSVRRWRHSRTVVGLDDGHPLHVAKFDRTADRALLAMEKRAHELGIQGVAVVAYFDGDAVRSWVSKMIVIGSGVEDHPAQNQKISNLLAVAYSKASEMADTLKNSGSHVRPPLTGEFGWNGRNRARETWLPHRSLQRRKGRPGLQRFHRRHRGDEEGPLDSVEDSTARRCLEEKVRDHDLNFSSSISAERAIAGASSLLSVAPGKIRRARRSAHWHPALHSRKGITRRCARHLNANRRHRLHRGGNRGRCRSDRQGIRDEITRAGLHCHSAHMQWNLQDLGLIFDDAHALGVDFVVSSALFPPGTSDGSTVDGYKKLAVKLNGIAQKTRDAGLQYAYHNHNFEFKDLGAGIIGYDILLSENDPSLVAFELDCGWMIAAGFQPIQYFKKYPRRYRMLHIKDFVAGSKISTSLAPDLRPQGTELGRGHIDYKPIPMLLPAQRSNTFTLNRSLPSPICRRWRPPKWTTTIFAAFRRELW